MPKIKPSSLWPILAFRANAATTFETNQEIAFAGEPGRWKISPLCHSEADHWVVALNEEAGKFGYSEPNYDKDIMRVNAIAAQLLTPVDPFTIDLVEDGESLTLHMRWDTTAVRFH